MVLESVTFGNSGNGVFYTGRGGLAASNVAVLNGINGIYCGEGCNARRNLARNNQDNGIRTGEGALAEGNLSCYNTSSQLHLESDSGYVNNALVPADGNGDKVVDGTGVSLGPNLCAKSTGPVVCN
jgi:hypothetical protein